MLKIVTDSTVQLSQEEIDRYGITIVPLSVMIDGTVYSDNVTITKEEFLEKMGTSTALPTTSQPSIGSYLELYDQLGADGSQVLSIHVSGDLSGTYSAAVQASQLTKTDITVWDSKFVDRPLAFQVITAAEMAQEGADVDSILQQLEVVRNESVFYVGIVTLENLVKGGRVSNTLGKISAFLNLKLMLKMTAAEGLAVDTKGRGMKSLTKQIDRIMDDIDSVSSLREISVTHVGLTEYTQQLIGRLKQQFPQTPITINQASPVLMTHAGKGAFAISYFKG